MKAAALAKFHAAVIVLCSLNSCNEEAREPDELVREPDQGALAAKEPAEGLTSDQLNEAIDRTVIPSVKITDLTFEKGVDYVIQIGSVLHPVKPLQFPFEVRAKVPEDLRISLRGADVAYRELISQFCAEAGVTWRVEKGVVVIENHQ